MKFYWRRALIFLLLLPMMILVYVFEGIPWIFGVDVNWFTNRFYAISAWCD